MNAVIHSKLESNLTGKRKPRGSGRVMMKKI